MLKVSFPGLLSEREQFTLISDVRQLLAQLDKALFKGVGKLALQDTNATLEAVQALVRLRLRDPES